MTTYEKHLYGVTGGRYHVYTSIARGKVGHNVHVG